MPIKYGRSGALQNGKPSLSERFCVDEAMAERRADPDKEVAPDVAAQRHGALERIQGGLVVRGVEIDYRSTDPLKPKFYATYRGKNVQVKADPQGVVVLKQQADGAYSRVQEYQGYDKRREDLATQKVLKSLECN